MADVSKPVHCRNGWAARYLGQLQWGAHYPLIMAIRPPGEPERVAGYTLSGHWVIDAEHEYDLIN